jgi:hypothetical protein
VLKGFILWLLVHKSVKYGLSVISIMRGSQKVPGIFDIVGLVHREFVPPRQCHCASFAEEAARQVAGRDSGFCIEPHSACCVITQPPHSPDLAPSDFWLFPVLKMCLKGTQLWRASNRVRRPNSGIFKKKYFRK